MLGEQRPTLFHSMSLHTRCPKRIVSTSAHRTVWRRRGARCYASDTANDPEWFQQVRTELLGRQPYYRREDVDLLHHEQLSTTLAGFVPRVNKPYNKRNSIVPLFELLTRFNVQVQSSKLLPDGTDPLHSPGEPWIRRMWAGGAVKFNPDLKLISETPFRLQSRVACVERVKDVRLQGTGDDAKVFVTIERRFTSVDQRRDVHGSQSEDNVRAHVSQQVDRDDDWSDALFKEERNLVFLKAKTAAELTAVQVGQTLVPRYLKCTCIASTFIPLLTRFSTYRTGFLTCFDANAVPSLPVLRSYVQRPPATPRSFVRPKYRRPSQSPCTWTAHAHADASDTEQASPGSTNRYRI